MSVLDRFRLDGQRLFITGGSRGFGRVIALAAAEAGADVVLNARDPEALERTAGEVRQRGRKAWTFAGDVADPEACEALCGRVLAEAGPIDIRLMNSPRRSLFLLALTLMASLNFRISAADDYKLGPDSMFQAGVPHGEVTKMAPWTTSAIFPGSALPVDWAVIACARRGGTRSARTRADA